MNRIAVPSIVVIVMFIMISCPMMDLDASSADMTLKFDEKGEFKMLIVADAQDTDAPQQAMLNLLNASLDAADPDLVVFLGDNIYGNYIVNDPQVVRKAISKIVSPVVDRGIPFSVVFGNHDDNGGSSKEMQMELYQSFEGCLSIEGEDLTGCGNYNLTIKDRTGTDDVFNLWFMDSNTYASDGGTYDYVHRDQIDWYIEKGNELAEANGGVALPSFLFQHIPVINVYGSLTEHDSPTDGAVRGFGAHSGKYYSPDPGLLRAGSMKIAPRTSDHDSGEFDAWTEQGDIVAAFFGHDHVNDYVISHEGIDLISTAGAGFYSYGNGGEHGTRLVTLHEEDLSYDTRMLYYSDIVDGPLPWGLIPTRGALVQNAIIYCAIAAVAIISAAVILYTRRKAHDEER
jgi:calcineurin-like phosphoesterase family protein